MCGAIRIDMIRNGDYVRVSLKAVTTAKKLKWRIWNWYVYVKSKVTREDG